MAKINLPIVYSQSDTRWANLLLGFNTDPQYNFYNYACLITCLTNICRYFGYDDTPVTINQKLINLGVNVGFSVGSALYVWGALTKIYPEIKEKLINIGDTPVSDVQMAEIRNALDNGMPVMLQLDYNPKTVNNDTHYVIAIDYNSNDQNDITIADPIGGKIHSLKDYLGWIRPSAKNSIFQYIIFTGSKPSINADTIPVAKKDFENLVNKSTQFDKIVHYVIGDNANPVNTSFEDIQRVIAGFKSDATTAKNTLIATQMEVIKANSEITNKNDQLSNMQIECQREIKIEKDRYSGLKGTMPNIAKIEALYIPQIKDLQSKLRDKQIEVGKFNLQLNACRAGQQKINIIKILSSIFTKKTTIK